MTREPEFVRSVRREEFIENAAELARSVPAEAEEPPKTAPALARACAVFRRFLDRIHLRCDGSQLLGQHVIERFFYGCAAWTTRAQHGSLVVTVIDAYRDKQPPSSPRGELEGKFAYPPSLLLRS